VEAVTFETVVYEKRDSVAWLTLNRPAVLNAYNLQMRDELFELLAAVRDDDEVRVCVLRGAGRAFCAGADLTEFGTAPSPTAARRIRFARDVWALLGELPVPTIAVLHGFAFGSGL
jgi:enoyl-CoA hydratase/carnithine racemase